MYDELARSLRVCSKSLKCDGCKLDKVDDADEKNCYDLLMSEAADAIENTSKAYQMMAEAYEAEVTKPRWIPVTEQLPEPFESVLVCYQREGRYGTSCGHYYIDRGTTIWKASGIIPTHWMPLPQPPEEE